jgi:transcriptional antiterminator RfaH
MEHGESAAAEMQPVLESADAAGANARWYVAYTQPSAELRAIAHLERQGYKVFCPRYRKIVRHARKTTATLAPLFPSYLFLRLDPASDRWRCVNGTRGVARLLAQGDVPQPVPHGAVELLLAHVGTDDAMDWIPPADIGCAVRIAEGPFTDFIGTLERLGAAGRVRVLLDLLGRSVSVTLHRQDLAPAA